MKAERLFKYLSFGLFATIAATLVVATGVEKLQGTKYALENIYHAEWMIALWGTATLSGIIYILQRRLHRQPATLCLHLAFAVILAGAAITYATGKQGQMHLRLGEYSNRYTSTGGTAEKLPFGISLHNFEITRHAGNEAPTDYISTIVIYDDERIEGKVSMNNIFKHKGYRFYQSDYDNDGRGTLLAVSHDPWGIGVTYTGYTMLLLAMLLFFVQPGSRFRIALNKGKHLFILAPMLFATPTASAEEIRQSPIPVTFADCSKECIAQELYDSISNNQPLAIACLATGIALFMVSCISAKENKRLRMLGTLISTTAFCILVYLSLQIALRWYLSGHIPLTNGYETMVFMAWSSMLLTLTIGRNNRMLTPFGYIICGLTLLVSGMGDADPQIAPMAPVLRSPLLSIHVSVIMISYTLFAFTMLNGIAAFIIKGTRTESAEEIAELQRRSILMLYPAVFLLTAGIFIGAVWANMSWGRYWGWDPKEVWALITLLVYSATLHSGSIKAMRRPMFFHIYCIVAFLTVLITYFGVNFILGGMHSYA